MTQILNFFTEKPITRMIRESITLEQFKEMMSEIRPTKLFSEGFIDGVPLFVITEYKADGKLMFYSALWKDKTPLETTLDGLYSALERNNGIENIFIVRGTEEEGKEVVAEEKK